MCSVQCSVQSDRAIFVKMAAGVFRTSVQCPVGSLDAARVAFCAGVDRIELSNGNGWKAEDDPDATPPKSWVEHCVQWSQSTSTGAR